MLLVLAYAMVIVFMWLIMTKRLSALVALIIVPILFGLLGGFGKTLGPMMLMGIEHIVPTSVMIMFAILYFGIMIDVGLFDFFVNQITRLAKGDPLKVIVGTCLLALLISLDGDGATCYLLTVAAMLPLYQRLGISKVILTCVIMLASGVMNILPWGGPTTRAASALNLSPSSIFVPMIPALCVTIVWIVGIAYWLGLKERKRLGIIKILVKKDFITGTALVGKARPKLFFVNLSLTLALLILLVLEIFPLATLFMTFFAIALLINYPNPTEQKECIMLHAKNVLPVIALIFAAGVFVGIFQGTKMLDAIATHMVTNIPQSVGSHLAVITGILSMPFTFFISNDAFYFGVLPILAKAAAPYGISTAQIARAAIIGQPVHVLSPLVASTYLLVGLADVDLGVHQRHTLLWSVSASIVMLIGGLFFNSIPF